MAPAAPVAASTMIAMLTFDAQAASTRCLCRLRCRRLRLSDGERSATANLRVQTTCMAAPRCPPQLKCQPREHTMSAGTTSSVSLDVRKMVPGAAALHFRRLWRCLLPDGCVAPQWPSSIATIATSSVRAERPVLSSWRFSPKMHPPNSTNGTAALASRTEQVRCPPLLKCQPLERTMSAGTM